MCEIPLLHQVCWQELSPQWGTDTGAVCEELQLMGRAHVEAVQGRLPPMGGTPSWSRGIQASLAAHGEDHDEANSPPAVDGGLRLVLYYWWIIAGTPCCRQAGDKGRRSLPCKHNDLTQNDQGWKL